jgi:undecaprenyl-diphosphatase
MGAHFDQLSNDNRLVQAIHTAVKGRARYKVSGLHHSEALKRYLEFRLSEEVIVTQVRANHFTGNILVIFHPDFSPNAIALLLQDIILGYTKETRKLPVRTAHIKPALEKAESLPINKTKLNKQRTLAGEQKISPWYVWFADSVITKFNTSSVSLSQMPIQKQSDQAGTQLIVASGVVSALVFGAGLLHRYGLDKGILLAIQKLHAPLLDRIMLGITLLGEPVVLLLICLGLGSGLLYYNRRTEATTLSIAAVGAIGLNYWLKVLFGRARPALWNHIVDVGLHSFPSGHAMASIAIYGFIGYILAKQFPQWRKRIFALTTVLIIAIGFSRLYLGVHWPTDVAAGYAVGLLWLIACILSLELSVARKGLEEQTLMKNQMEPSPA